MVNTEKMGKGDGIQLELEKSEEFFSIISSVIEWRLLAVSFACKL